MSRRSRRGSIDFGIREISAAGIVSSCFFAAGVLIFLAAVFWAYLNAGRAGIWLGAAGFAILSFSAAGLVLGLFGLSREGYRHGPDILGTVGNALVLSGICFLFYYGTSI